MSFLCRELLIFTSSNPYSSIYFNALLLTEIDTENEKIQGHDCLERERKYIGALCRIKFNFFVGETTTSAFRKVFINTNAPMNASEEMIFSPNTSSMLLATMNRDSERYAFLS